MGTVAEAQEEEQGDGPIAPLGVAGQQGDGGGDEGVADAGDEHQGAAAEPVGHRGQPDAAHGIADRRNDLRQPDDGGLDDWGAGTPG
ncbi:MAG: hypothetical protein K6U14_12035 [Firmicutes bacterium]|nr:hypothetical protein [Alicyclobacillaceae bacterium]MCL6498342.1 hypothetical protein [Bacillota bacterium]